MSDAFFGCDHLDQLGTQNYAYVCSEGVHDNPRLLRVLLWEASDRITKLEAENARLRKDMFKAEHSYEERVSLEVAEHRSARITKLDRAIKYHNEECDPWGCWAIEPDDVPEDWEPRQ